MIRSLSFSESVSLGCDLHKCFSVSSPLCETGLHGGKRELDISLSSGQLGCDKIVSFESRPSLEQNVMVYFKGGTFPLPLLEAGGDFSMIFTVRT